MRMKIKTAIPMKTFLIILKKMQVLMTIIMTAVWTIIIVRTEMLLWTMKTEKTAMETEKAAI